MTNKKCIGNELPHPARHFQALLSKVTLIANKRQLHLQQLQQMANKSNKSSISLIVVSLLAVLLVPTSQIFSALEVDTMLTTIDNLFFVPNPQSRMEIRKFLRAAFHDCMGGCDGSLNLLNSANRGLQKFANLLYNTHRQLQNPRSPTYSIFRRLSRADFWVLCEQRALAWGMKNAGYVPSLSGAVFSYGRVTTNPYDTDNYQGTLPDGIDSWQSMLGDFAAGIPVLSEADIVTLLGLHGSGTASFNNSGFSGPWGPASDKNVVNNNFFINLLSYGYPGSNFGQIKAANAPATPNGPGPTLDGDFQSAAPATDKIQWQRTAGNSGARMMLPIDMQIYLSFTPNATGGQTAGQYCPQGNNGSIYPCTNINTPNRRYLPLANTAGLAMSYAQNSNLFYINLISAYNKMVGYTSQNTYLTPFAPGWFCVNGVAKCLGDVYFSGCDPNSIITC